jgi:eukaryotic-like serine/threonine-protein kinase
VTASPAPDASFIALQAAVAGRFSLERELGRGGMGVVYLARDVQLERHVAIKLLAPSLAARADMRRRFLREARIATQCFHPNIVPIHEVAESGELAWFVMGYVLGETLAERLRRAGPLSAEALRRLGREIGWALAYAHERGVVHRDVKPENILLEMGTGRALIADFGIAWHEPGEAGADPQASGEVMGTAHYMAPEQAMGASIDGRADLYALGVTLYLAATGRHPYDGRNAVAVMVARQTQSAPSLRLLAPQLPATIADAVDQCLAAAPADRYDTAADFVSALERGHDGHELPTEARPARAAAVGTGMLLDWTVAIGLCGVFFVMGEEPGFGRGMTVSILKAVLTFAGAATVLRAGETLVAARRALRQGVTPNEVVDAIAPAPAAPERAPAPLRDMALLMAGFCLAIVQGGVNGWSLPSFALMPATLLTTLVPPLLVHRALTGARRRNGLSAWLHAFVRRPLAQRLVGWLSGGPAVAPRVMPADAPTELLLGHAAEQILARLPASARSQLPTLPAAASALAGEAAALRARVAELSDAQRRLRAGSGSSEHTAERQFLATERARVQERLATTIAALETMRLDLLRLEASQTLPGGLTEHLEVVRDLQRHVDAALQLRQLLERPTPV